MAGVLDGKNIIVTGSSRGIGWAIAKAASQAGAGVLLHGRSNEEFLQKRATELPGNADYIVADLMDETAPQAIIDKGLASFGEIHGLVNNAGIFPRNNIDTLDTEAFNRMVAVNVRAPLFLCQQAVFAFRQHGKGGSIVNIGSINAHCGQTDILVYSMTKGALQTMSRNLGDSLGSENIRVNQLNVGWTWTQTEHATQLREGRPENWMDQLPAAFAPSGGILMPEHIAPHAVFWLSEQSWPVNGQVYEVEQYPIIGRNKINES